MSRVQPIPRISLIWLLIAQVLVILPHLLHLPVWIIGLWLFCAGWRVQIFRMRARYPNAWAKALLMLVAGFGVFFSRGSLIGLEAGTVLLVAAFILKLVEMRNRRDALVLILLGFFTVVTSYLFDDSLLAGLYSLLPVCALLAALIGLQQSLFAEQPLATLRLSATLLLQALPLMLLIFLFFPRIDPLWSMPLLGGKALSGLSDSMTPGDIAELSRSDALAFRASFVGPVPPQAQLYWRALTMERFDGKRWSQAPARALAASPAWQKRGEPWRYNIVMQPSAHQWLFGMDLAQTSLPGARLLGDFSLQAASAVDRSLLYQVESWPQALREPDAPESTLQRNLQLPQRGDPRTRAWAQELKARYQQPDALVQALLQHFNREAFFYTLKPPRTGPDPVDAFLFDTRRGFCAHYAGAMTYVLRAAGIPARLVAGYQGGEVNPAGKFVSVRQFDAHAWVEYWQAGKGWQTVDPTFQVAPQRIEAGLEEALAGEGSFLEGSPLSLLRYRQLSWLNDLRLGWDNLNYGWQRWVLGYQSRQQLDLLKDWFGELQAGRLAMVLVGGGGLLFGVLALWLLKPWQGRARPLHRRFQQFERLLLRQGLKRRTGEGARAFAERCAGSLPDQAARIRHFLQLWEAQCYAGKPVDPVLLKRALRDLRRALPWRFVHASSREQGHSN
ncbi:Transglutaminase-like enzyme, putative cysteine protease [Pseudomonas pohangensis]|uniref:Transglutaminase-like enzyme, putative cysteine protease n=1 Tax=Pseudomonas pohangensis TaxID=364197 RepID=A0A1H2ETG4_9PSED|nr:DUF3488 and DUF4129 domain-containing transglutaminase family protein [Pseudomonas pohangensis]SDT98329.1 Transglutaminase-like enzyme, putative cysteine protease [Pseudomonas pohangensis]